MLTEEEIHNRYVYHAPNEERKELHQKWRVILEGAATWAEINFPEGRDKSLVHTKLEEAMFWGNASLARQKEN